MSLPSSRSIQELPVETSSTDLLLHKHYSTYRVEKQGASQSPHSGLKQAGWEQLALPFVIDCVTMISLRKKKDADEVRDGFPLAVQP